MGYFRKKKWVLFNDEYYSKKRGRYGHHNVATYENKKFKQIRQVSTKDLPHEVREKIESEHPEYLETPIIAKKPKPPRKHWTWGHTEKS